MRKQFLVNNGQYLAQRYYLKNNYIYYNKIFCKIVTKIYNNVDNFENGRFYKAILKIINVFLCENLKIKRYEMCLLMGCKGVTFNDIHIE